MALTSSVVLIPNGNLKSTIDSVHTLFHQISLPDLMVVGFGSDTWPNLVVLPGWISGSDALAG